MPKKPRKSSERLRPVYELIFELAEPYGRMCEVCERKMRGPTPGFTFHHLEYREGEKTHKHFKSRLKYYEYLKPILKEYPKEFAFICNACHHSIDGPRGLKRRKKMNVIRLFLLYFRTNT